MRILYVDLDDKNKKLCSDGECEFFHKKSGDDAIEFLETQAVDIILIGSTLEDGNGVSLVYKINESKFKHLPVIYIYKNKDEFPIEQRFSLGIIDYVSEKELTPGRVLGYLDRLQEQEKLLEGLKKLSIAIIDDSMVSLKVMSVILSKAGIGNFKTFNDPRDLIISGEVFDIYFIDMVMPGITGDKLVAMMRGQSPKSIIITMSSIDNVKTISNVLSSGADDYIIKPFNKEILLARLKTNFRAYSLLNELDNKNEKLDLLTKTDSLTGAYNHGFIFKKIEDEIEKATYHGIPLSILLIDLDFFKEINDNYGHVAGDNVLKDLTSLINNNINKSDYFGRYGGEEFLLVLGNTQLGEAAKVTSKIHDDFMNLKIEGVGRHVTFSGGLIQWSGESVSELVHKADTLLYEAKKNGRNNIKW